MPVIVPAAIILAQVACVLEMLLKGQTLRMPGAGGALTAIRRRDSKLGFYVMLAVWIALFATVDVLVLPR